MNAHDEPSWDDEPTLGHSVRQATLVLEAVPPKPVLLVESGHSLGRYFHLPEAPCEVRVGRGRDADCRVRDRSVSRSHVLLRILEDGRVELRDLDALNGTWINGRRLRGLDQVFDGDRIRLGDLDLRIAWMSERDLAYQDRIAKQVRLAERDALTGLRNRNFLLERLPDLIATNKQDDRSLSLIAIDVDRFKSVNDGWGHGTGDRVLAQLARVLAEGVRPEDEAIRAGGEEFWILLPDTSCARASRVADRLRRDVLQADYTDWLPSSWPITISAGVAELADHESPEEWMNRADQALYEAKRAGRNRVAVADPEGRAELAGAGAGETTADGLGPVLLVTPEDAKTPNAAATQPVEVLDMSLGGSWDALPPTEIDDSLPGG
jgi:two-component system, cell cycle response regulator